MKPDFSKVKLVVFDVDGVLTDGRLYYGPEGESLKCFHVRDGVGIKMLQNHGIPVAVISAKDSPALAARMKDLGVRFFRPGSKEKLGDLSLIMGELGITLKQVAYVGDDMVDVPVMEKAGVAIAPADAYPLAKKKAHWVTDSKGGEGVAREVADTILGARFDLPSIYVSATKPEFEGKPKG